MHVIKYNAYLGIDNNNFMNNRDWYFMIISILFN
jgi:hypothetical protein